MIGPFIRNRRGTAAVEFALSLPLMLVLLFGAMEAGHYFWTEHKLVKAVRDGVRFAARAPVENLCNGPAVSIDATLEDQIQNLTATGQIAADGVPKVPGWSADQVIVTVGCEAFMDTGIYTDLGANGPLVTVSSGQVPYPSILNGLGVLDNTISLSAEASAAVMGI